MRRRRRARRSTLVALVILSIATVPAGGGRFMSPAGAQNDPMFSEAEAYERFMGRWSRALAPMLVRFSNLADGDAALDVGSGTGALAAAIAAQAPASRIVGIDPAANYVALANLRRPSERIAFEVGDAQKMRFADGEFDRTLSLLVVNFIPDADRAVREMARVTRSGGTVAAAVWDYGDGMEMLRAFWDEAAALHPEHADKDERHMRFCRQGELATLWARHGLQDVSEAPLTIETRFASFDDYWEPFTLGQGPAGAYVAALADADRAALRQRLRQRLEGAGAERPITMRARAWAVRGTVPRR